jgi:hypothetical protein
MFSRGEAMKPWMIAVLCVTAIVCSFLIGGQYSGVRLNDTQIIRVNRLSGIMAICDRDLGEGGQCRVLGHK